jgi:hypothetical protein
MHEIVSDVTAYVRSVVLYHLAMITLVKMLGSTHMQYSDMADGYKHITGGCKTTGGEL